MSGYRQVCAAVRRWQQGEDGTGADDVAALALRLAAGDEARARRLLASAAEWWGRMGSYVDVNGDPIRRSA